MSVSRFIMNFVLLILYCLESFILKFIPRRFRYKDIKGQIVLITGGGSGFGRLLALRFAELGARIVVWDHNMTAALETVNIVKDQGGEAFAFYCDVSSPQEVYSTAAKVKQLVGKVDILINNANIALGKKLLQCSDENIKKTFDVNVLSHFWTCKAFLPDMMAENKGHVVSIVGLAGFSGFDGLTDYSASKFAAVGFEESLRLELHKQGYDGITSSVVCPYLAGMLDGIETSFIPSLSPEYIINSIVSAVLTNQEVIFIPRYFKVFLSLKWLFPSKIIHIKDSLFGLDEVLSSLKESQ